ncbi:MAG: 4Fe-4S binding protein, partial [Alphaproteobacteria bacterium]
MNLLSLADSLDNDSRREFLRHVLAGTASATVLMVFGPGAAALTGGDAQAEGDPKNRFAYVININRCIGCGNCVRACNRENNVPPAVFRTWVERYIVTEEGVHVE